MPAKAYQIYVQHEGTGQRPFRGRESLIDFITETAKRNQTEKVPKLGIALIGQRGIGKNTILTAATDHLKTKGWEISRHFVTQNRTESIMQILKAIKAPSRARSVSSGVSSIALVIHNAKFSWKNLNG